VTRLLLVPATAWGAFSPSAGAEPRYRSLPPVRPLPAPSDRPMDRGPAFFVDPVKGADRNDGSRPAPWKTLGHALRQLKPGDPLSRRGGPSDEHVTAAVSGTAAAPGHGPLLPRRAGGPGRRPPRVLRGPRPRLGAVPRGRARRVPLREGLPRPGGAGGPAR